MKGSLRGKSLPNGKSQQRRIFTDEIPMADSHHRIIIRRLGDSAYYLMLSNLERITNQDRFDEWTEKMASYD